MNQPNSAPQAEHKSAITDAAKLTAYEIAVLSTLFEPRDADKVLQLATQWGYQQDFLRAVWHTIHRKRLGDS